MYPKSMPGVHPVVCWILRDLVAVHILLKLCLIHFQEFSKPIVVFWVVVFRIQHVCSPKIPQSEPYQYVIIINLDREGLLTV